MIIAESQHPYLASHTKHRRLNQNGVIGLPGITLGAHAIRSPQKHHLSIRRCQRYGECHTCLSPNLGCLQGIHSSVEAHTDRHSRPTQSSGRRWCARCSAEDEFNPPDEDFCPPLSFGAIASINKLHDTVTRFANAYAQDVIIASLNKRHGQVFSRLAVISKSEIGRIMRALYNLEMYFICCREQLLCELDSQEEYISTGILPNLDHLLRKFAPWNVEQMAGVWEYMMVTVIPG